MVSVQEKSIMGRAMQEAIDAVGPRSLIWWSCVQLTHLQVAYGLVRRRFEELPELRIYPGILFILAHILAIMTLRSTSFYDFLF